jgi:dTDP-glucose 4,6-dehydratase
MSHGTEARIIVTGGCGFIGSNLVEYLLGEHPDWEIHNLDALSYAAGGELPEEVTGSGRYFFHRIDLAEREQVAGALESIRPDGIFHLAAETHVDNSIRDPDPFLRSNVTGTYNLLEEARRIWGARSSRRLLHCSTDEVFGSAGADEEFTESTPYAPRNPYSAAKAASDHLVAAWHHTYGMNVVRTNASNNYGRRQHREKLIPTVIATALASEPIPVYGDGGNVRDWLHVDDHCRALDMVFGGGEPGDHFVVGGGSRRRNIDLVRLICGILDDEVGEGGPGGYARLITFVEDRPGHDRGYSVDSSRIRSRLGWAPRIDFNEGLRQTVRWFARRLPTDS